MGESLGLEGMGRATLRPDLVFPRLAGHPQGPGRAFLRMLVWRTPLGLFGGMAALRGIATALAQLKRLEGPFAQVLQAAAPEAAPEDLRAALGSLPSLPEGPGVVLGVGLLVLLGLTGAWLHHTAWDHGCLWLLKGVRKEHPWRATLEAEASALQVGAVGTAFGLLTLFPIVGALLWPLVVLVDLWFWGLRGAALAAFHGCPLWKGIVATLLHGFLVLLLGGGLLVYLVLLASSR